MILDTSAIVAVVFEEPEGDEFLEKIQAERVAGVGAPTLVETTIVLAGRGLPRSRELLEGFLARTGVAVVVFERVHWEVAAQAWLSFGRGRHPARLNYGDCVAYATARVAGRPLLAKGDDFAKTDIALA